MSWIDEFREADITRREYKRNKRRKTDRKHSVIFEAFAAGRQLVSSTNPRDAWTRFNNGSADMVIRIDDGVASVLKQRKAG